MTKLLPVALAAVAIASLAACGTGASSSASPPAASASPPAVKAAAPAGALAPFAPGHFPSTADGKLAKAICASWGTLRQQYADKLAAGTSSFDLNGWFSSAAWETVQNDAATLGNDPEFSNLETSLGLVITGDAASTANASALDGACEHAN